MEEKLMILGMDIWVFTAWIGTILAAILCLLYGIYSEFLINQKKKKTILKNQKKSKIKEH
jgi:uncharacterized membrane protein YobD (UPF0266 family)